MKNCIVFKLRYSIHWVLVIYSSNVHFIFFRKSVKYLGKLSEISKAECGFFRFKFTVSFYDQKPFTNRGFLKILKIPLKKCSYYRNPFELCSWSNILPFTLKGLLYWDRRHESLNFYCHRVIYLQYSSGDHWEIGMFDYYNIHSDPSKMMVNMLKAKQRK